MTITFVPLSEINPRDWDNLVRGSPDGWIFSLHSWQRLILGVSEWAFEDHSFGLLENGRLVAVMPLQYQASTRRVGSSGWGGSGPVVAGGRAGADRDRAFAAALERSAEVARAAGATTLEVSCSPVTRSSLESRWGVNPFAVAGFEDRSRLSQVIDLRSTRAALWAGLSQTARRWIRKAEAAGFRAERASWPALVDAYYDVHVETYRRTGVPPHPRTYFAGIAADLAAAGDAVLWAAMTPSGEPVAFHNDARFGGGAYYHTGCSRNAVQDVGLNYLLMWAAIEDAHAHGCGWYDVGWIFPGTTDPKLVGLTSFKTRFGGEPHRSFRGELALSQPEIVCTEPVVTHTPVRLRSRATRIAKGAFRRIWRACRHERSRQA